MCIKGFFYPLSHDCHSGTDRDVSIAYRSVPQRTNYEQAEFLIHQSLTTMVARKNYSPTQ